MLLLYVQLPIKCGVCGVIICMLEGPHIMYTPKKFIGERYSF